ncbi:hypothetical protein A4X13_0g7486 [Tilletia indica]|uniref:Uncharacterized protein n=1 Tax=Tilletia indica TaxID=43049 RepID=A0A8T8SK12_9BASI|nr:hypothetical protein A4X13_0g7486 [Tilletia indica]
MRRNNHQHHVRHGSNAGATGAYIKQQSSAQIQTLASHWTRAPAIVQERCQPDAFPKFHIPINDCRAPPLSTSAIHKSLILATFLVAPRQRCRWNVEATAKPTLGRTVWFSGIGGRGIMVSVAELR